MSEGIDMNAIIQQQLENNTQTDKNITSKQAKQSNKTDAGEKQSNHASSWSDNVVNKPVSHSVASKNSKETSSIASDLEQTSFLPEKKQWFSMDELLNQSQANTTEKQTKKSSNHTWLQHLWTVARSLLFFGVLGAGYRVSSIVFPVEVENIQTQIYDTVHQLSANLLWGQVNQIDQTDQTKNTDTANTDASTVVSADNQTNTESDTSESSEIQGSAQIQDVQTPLSDSLNANGNTRENQGLQEEDTIVTQRDTILPSQGNTETTTDNNQETPSPDTIQPLSEREDIDESFSDLDTAFGMSDDAIAWYIEELQNLEGQLQQHKQTYQASNNARGSAIINTILNKIDQLQQAILSENNEQALAEIDEDINQINRLLEALP